MSNATTSCVLDRPSGTSARAAYDACTPSVLHLWADAAVCGTELADPVVFSTTMDAVTDICCVHCERAALDPRTH